MSNTLNLLKSKFVSNERKIISAFFLLFGIVCVVLLSGFGYTTFSISSKSKILLYIISFIFFISCFALKIKTSIFKESIEKKRIPFPPYIYLSSFLITLLCLISFIFNKNKADNINTYIAFILTILLSFLILTTFDKEKILKTFKNVLFVLVTVAILIHTFTAVSKTFYPSSFFVGEKNLYGTHLFVTNDTLSGLTNTFYFKIRLTSVFWEPSVLAVMLIAALVCEIYTKKDKLTFIRIIVFVVGIILSQSTTAYILLPIVLILFLVEKIHGVYKKSSIVFIFLISIVLIIFFEKQIIEFLAKILPDIFSKMSTDKPKGSFITRLESFWTCFNVFLKNPIFGFGGYTARSQYFNISHDAVDAQTSTFGYVLASFGLAGAVYIISIIIGIILCKKINTFAKFVLIPLVFLLSNAQGQAEILIINVLYFMPFALCAIPKKMQSYNEQTFPKTYSNESTRTVKDCLFQKNDNGEISRNVVGALLIKGIAIFIALFSIPIYIKYFDNNDSTYGIWIAITSILSVVMVFDFGMGNGLKNKLIKNILNKDDELSKTYISTTYALTAIIGIAIFAIFSALFFVISDDVLFDIFFYEQDLANVDLLSFRIGVSIILLSIGSHFFIKNINYVLQAHQQNAITGIFMVITNTCLMIFAILFSNVFPSKYKILALSIAYFVFLITPLLVASIILYRKKFKHLTPSIKYIDFKQSKAVVSTSFKFFAVQIGNLVLWSLNEFIILLAFGHQSAMVAEYKKYYNLFSLMPLLLGTVIQQPLWTAISKADAESNRGEMKKYFKFLAIVTCFVIVANLLVAAILPFVFSLWLGEYAPIVTTEKLIAFIVYSVIYSSSLFFVIIMNALSLFKTQIASAILAIAIKIPFIVLATQVFEWNIGWELVIFINTFCYLPIVIFGAFEIIKRVKRIENKRNEA